MFKTLGCLAAAMTGTAAFLGWLDPSPLVAMDALSVEQIGQWAQSAVADDVSIRAGQWLEVAIAAEPAALASGSLLVATADNGDWHFHVGIDGRVWRGQRWNRQESAPGFPHMIRIQAPPVSRVHPLSPRQWCGVRALIASLNETVTTPGSFLPVRLPQGWERMGAIEDDTALRTHSELPSAG